MKDEFYVVVIVFFGLVWLSMIFKEFVRIAKMFNEKRIENEESQMDRKGN